MTDTFGIPDLTGGPWLELTAPTAPSGHAGTVTAIVPTHDDAANLSLLLPRLLAEPDVSTAIVLASATEDDTFGVVLEVADRHPGRVRLLAEDRRSGKFAAVNLGLALAPTPFAYIVSGDVLPAVGAVARLRAAVDRDGVGAAGGQPVPRNPGRSVPVSVGRLMWRLHHRMALWRPKLGESILVRTDAVAPLPPTAVDEAAIQARLDADGWASVYVPDVIIDNRVPERLADLVKQRRRTHAGHLWLARRTGYAVPSLSLGQLVRELLGDALEGGQIVRGAALAAGAVAVDAWARTWARLDVVRGREQHVWALVESAKDPKARPGGGAHGRRAGVPPVGLAEAPPGQPDR